MKYQSLRRRRPTPGPANKLLTPIIGKDQTSSWTPSSCRTSFSKIDNEILAHDTSRRQPEPAADDHALLSRVNSRFVRRSIALISSETTIRVFGTVADALCSSSSSYAARSPMLAGGAFLGLPAGRLDALLACGAFA